MSKKQYIYKLYNRRSAVFFLIGLGMIFLFIVIYIVASIIGRRPDYAGFFYNNISNNIGLTVMTSLQAGVLGIGILFLLIASYNISPKILCYDDKFEVSHLFHNKNVIPFGSITSVETKVIFVRKVTPWSKNDKEVIVTLKNPIYPFNFVYKTSGYFDDIVTKQMTGLSKSGKTYLHRDTLAAIFKKIQTVHKISVPFLPDEQK